jgi:hypothetical protein
MRPIQHFRSGLFADLSFTLFRNDHFFLDLYIWNHQDTNIHDHHFCGAFQVVQGESFHLSYDFISEEKKSSWLEKGRLEVVEKTNLLPGETKKIAFYDRFIHQNIHTTNPCVTLCLRSNDHPEIMLNSYYNKGMKIGLYRSYLIDVKLLEAVQYLVHQNLSKADEEQALMSSVSDHALYSILTGQKNILANISPQLLEIIHRELRQRNPDQYGWFVDAIEKQNKLVIQLQSMFKTQA